MHHENRRTGSCYIVIIVLPSSSPPSPFPSLLLLSRSDWRLDSRQPFNSGDNLHSRPPDAGAPVDQLSSLHLQRRRLRPLSSVVTTPAYAVTERIEFARIRSLILWYPFVFDGHPLRKGQRVPPSSCIIYRLCHTAL